MLLELSFYVSVDLSFYTWLFSSANLNKTNFLNAVGINDMLFSLKQFGYVEHSA